MKGRKNGCPVNIKHWIIEILNVATQQFVRIFGLTSLTRNVESDTEDGSADTDSWAEPYVTKRNGSLSLKGKEVVLESTGEKDEGQELLNAYALSVGCESDATIRITDPYGHSTVCDYIVTSAESSADDGGTELSWDLEQVGEAEPVPYRHVTSIAVHDAGSPVTTLALTAGGVPKLLTVVFTPAEASNKRFRVANSKKNVAAVGNVTESGFTVTPVAAGSTTVTVTTINGGKTASITVKVT